MACRWGECDKCDSSCFDCNERIQILIVVKYVIYNFVNVEMEQIIFLINMMNFYVNFVIRKKHISHINKLISEYQSYLKTIWKYYETELDDTILNDEGYKLFQFWKLELQNEIIC